jgi:hypothetical protein
MTTVHIENTVQDFDTWKANFDSTSGSVPSRGCSPTG